MKAKLFLYAENYYLQRQSGELSRLRLGEAREFLLNFLNEKYYENTSPLPCVTTEYNGDIIAEVDDNYHLVVFDETAFRDIIKAGEARFISVPDYAALHGKSNSMVRRLCQNGRFPGALRIGNTYIIPADAAYPKD
jgi:hypothetical protein